MPSSDAGPTFVALAAFAACSNASAYRERSTSIRVGALQDWPELRIQRATPFVTASSAALAKIIFAPLPPNSRLTRFRVSAAAFEIAMPAREEPVKLTISTSGCTDSWLPTPVPSPFTILNTPAGKPASWINSANSKPERGAISEGFNTMVQPVAMAGIAFNTIWFIGQFQGVIKAVTPIGSITVRSFGA